MLSGVGAHERRKNCQKSWAYRPLEGALDWFQNWYSNRIDIMTRVINEQCCSRLADFVGSANLNLSSFKFAIQP